MAQLTLSRLGKAALDLLYPPRCALCGRHGTFLCPGCEASLPAAAGDRCRVCWLPLARAAAARPDSSCRSCARRSFAFTALRSPFRYEGPARQLVQRFKFGNFSAIAPSLAPSMADLVEWPLDAVQPVPLWPRHERERGYNQSRLLAQEVATSLGLPLSQAVRRVTGGPAQARSTREERFRNVAGAFTVPEAAGVEDKRVLLVDDVATTGATLDECARVLRASGAREVFALTFARED
jgi:competence protein ComFC